MTQFVINDLDSSLKLDNQALSNIRGGRSISDFSQYSNIRIFELELEQFPFIIVIDILLHSFTSPSCLKEIEVNFKR